MVIYISSPSTQDLEAGGMGGKCLAGLHNETLSQNKEEET